MIGCVPLTESNIYGTYVSNIHKNSIDTLHIFKDGTYEHLIYRSKDNSFVYKNVGNWQYKSARIKLINFIANEDLEYKKDQSYYWKEYESNSSSPVRNYLGEIKIDINADLGHYYVKVKGNGTK
jgi:hypothetical protein